jgi:hypothetical protein
MRKYKKYHTLISVLKSNRKLIETQGKLIPLTHIQLNKIKENQNVSRTCYFKFWREFNKQKVKF